jgi:putative transcriptional regulator
MLYTGSHVWYTSSTVKRGGYEVQIKLYDARKRSKLSQQEVADILGISRNSYGQKERGDVSFNLEEMFALSELLNTSLDDLFISKREGVK